MRDLATSLRSIVEALTSRFDYHALYPATVVSQADDGTVDVRPDNPRAGKVLADLTGVRIRNGIPGLKVVVPKGARVRLGFEGGDPAQPYAALWDSGSLAGVQIYLAADAWAVRGGVKDGPQSFVGVDENGAISLTTAMGSLIAVDPRTGIVELTTYDPNNLDANGRATWVGTVQLGPSGFSGTFAGGVCGFSWDAKGGAFTSVGAGQCSLAHTGGQLGVGITPTSLASGIVHGGSPSPPPSLTWLVAP